MTTNLDISRCQRLFDSRDGRLRNLGLGRPRRGQNLT